jgi:hypothetical protein
VRTENLETHAEEISVKNREFEKLNEENEKFKQKLFDFETSLQVGNFL